MTNKIDIKKMSINIFVEEILLKHIQNQESVVLFGEHNVGKSSILNALSKHLNLKINHSSEIRNISFLKNWPKGEIIMVDEATRYLPQGKNSIKYKNAIIVSHNEKDGEYYAKFLSDSKIVKYNII